MNYAYTLFEAMLYFGRPDTNFLSYIQESVYCCSCLCIFVVVCVILCVFVLLCGHCFFFTLDAGLLARSQYPEGPVTGHLDAGFSWFPCA